MFKSLLQSVVVPKLNRDLVSLGWVQTVEEKENGVEVSLHVDLPLPSLLVELEARVRTAIEPHLKNGQTLTVRLDRSLFSTHKPLSSQAPLPKVKNILAVSSGKGGVGKSTVAVNLSVSLALQGFKVGILDADIYGPNVPMMMGATQGPTFLDSDQPGVRSKMIPPLAQGIKVMSMAFMMEMGQPATWRGPMLHNVLTQFCRDVEWGELDFLVIDFPPGTGDVQLSMAQILSMGGAVLVTTPQAVALDDVRRAFSMWKSVRVPMLGIIQNMSTFECPSCKTAHPLFGDSGGQQLSQETGLPVLAELPLIPKVRTAGDSGQPVAIYGSAGDPFKEMTENLLVSFYRLAKRSAAATAKPLEPSPSLS